MVLHGAPEGSLQAILHPTRDLKGLVALFPLADASTETDGSPAADTTGRHSAAYKFKVRGHAVAGLRIELLDGLDGRAVTAEMRAASDKEGLVRREAVKAAMKHAWARYAPRIFCKSSYY